MAVVRSGTTVTVYRNGVSLGSGTFHSNGLVLGDDTTIGANTFDNSINYGNGTFNNTNTTGLCTLNNVKVTGETYTSGNISNTGTATFNNINVTGESTISGNVTGTTNFNNINDSVYYKLDATNTNRLNGLFTNKYPNFTNNNILVANLIYYCLDN